MKKLALTSALLSATLVLALTGCGNQNSSTAPAESKSPAAAPISAKDVTIKFNTASGVSYDAFKKFDLAGSYKKIHPNVTIEIEKVKDDLEQNNVLKIRNAAGELPDVIMGSSTQLEMFKDKLEPLDGLPAAADNKFADSFKVDGKVLGVPDVANYDNIVYYNKDIFAEYNLSIPKTWDELIDAVKKIQAGGKYIPIALGAKDVWPVFPFTESTPFLVSSDTNIMNNMVSNDAPFAKGSAFYTAYSMFKKLADVRPFGPDPLGTGFDQAKTMVGAKKAAMFFRSQWAVNDVLKAAGDKVGTIGTFIPPFRNSASDPMNIVVNAGGFIYINKDSKVKEEAKQFLNWYFSKDWYEQYVKELGVSSTSKTIQPELAPLIKDAVSAYPDAHFIPMNLGNGEYARISAQAKFDTKVFGPAIIAGKDFDTLINDYNKAWKDARATK